MFKSSEDKYPVFLLYATIWFVFSYLYVAYIANVFAYEGYLYSYSIERIVAGFLVAMILVVLTPSSSEVKFSFYFYHLMLIIILVPMSVLYSFADKSEYFFIQVCIAYVIIRFLPIILPVITIRIPTFQDRLFPVVLISFVILLTLVIIWLNGFGSFNLNLMLVYEFRDSAAENLPDFFGYIIPITTKVVLPFCAVLFVKQGRYYFAAFSLFLTVLLFGLTSHKSILFYPLVMVAFYLIMQSRRPVQNILFGMLAIVLIAGVSLHIASLYDSDFFMMAGSMFLRRALIVPAELNYVYFDFFSNNRFVYWSNSGLTFGLANYPYTQTVSHVIGDFRFEGTNTGSNTGWLGSGYAHAGFSGLLLYAVIISYFLKYADLLVKKMKDKALAVSVLIIPSLTLITSSDLPTTFLTHGMIVGLIIVAMQKRAYQI